VEGREPGLSKLKDRRSWEKRKSKGRAHIQKMVINILKLYRLRAAVSRPVYPSDGEAQARFESAFKYQPTDHQQQVLLPRVYLFPLFPFYRVLELCLES
jgi:transcription-repair coupling factor (superfamily II helicase)